MLSNLISFIVRLFLFSQIFLNEHLAAQDLMCWMEIEAFRGIPVSDKAIRDIKAKQLRSHYFNKKYFFGPSSPATKEQQRQVLHVPSIISVSPEIFIVKIIIIFIVNSNYEN